MFHKYIISSLTDRRGMQFLIKQIYKYWKGLKIWLVLYLPNTVNIIMLLLKWFLLIKTFFKKLFYNTDYNNNFIKKIFDFLPTIHYYVIGYTKYISDHLKLKLLCNLWLILCNRRKNWVTFNWCKIIYRNLIQINKIYNYWLYNILLNKKKLNKQYL